MLRADLDTSSLNVSAQYYTNGNCLFYRTSEDCECHFANAVNHESESLQFKSKRIFLKSSGITTYAFV